MRRAIIIVSLVGLLGGYAAAAGPTYDNISPANRAGYDVAAAVLNIAPIASAYAAPKCLPGYVPCKILAAGFNTLAAGVQLIFSGGSDLAQTRAILHRGYAGDWYLTGRHVAGDAAAQPYPDPSASESPAP
ncbi:MAG: hypothetical protein U0807_03080 [Candidatus Binatia bacterium]